MDERESIRIIRNAEYDGINYFDTAYTYKHRERILRKALGGGLRNKVNIATKSPILKIKRHCDFEKFFIRQLKRLKTNYIDFYLLHGLDKYTWKKVKSFGLIEKLDNAKKEGKIKYDCFSFYDNTKLFKEIIDIYEWDMCQIQLNFLQSNYQAGVRGLEYASLKKIGVVIMEPLLGGILTENVPEYIVEEWNKSGIIRTPAERAFR